MTAYQTYYFIFWLSLAAILYPISVLVIDFRRQPLYYKWLTALLLFSFLSDLVNQIQFYTIHLSMNYIINIYTVINPVLLCCFFYSVLNWQRLKPVLVVISVSHVAFSLFNLFFIQKETINSYSSIVETLIIMTLSILYYYKVLREMVLEKIYRSGLFWIVSAMFTFNSAKLVLFAFTHYLIVLQDNLILLMDIHNSMSIATSLIVGVGVSMQDETDLLDSVRPG
jgi:hypothetical protein